MACSLRSGFYAPGFCESVREFKPKGSLGNFRTVGALQFTDSKPTELMIQTMDVSDRKVFSHVNVKAPVLNPIKAPINKILRWWEKNLQANMVEINSAEQFLESLLNAGDKLVIVDFFSPGCGGCKALHPKICQLAEANPDAIFLTVNNEELRKMSSALRVNVIPFFRFYRGAAGRLCSFSCTNATIKKFKDAVQKYSAEEYAVGPAKGLEDHELLALASVGEISRKVDVEKQEHLGVNGSDLSITVDKFGENKVGSKEESAVLLA